MVPPHLFVVMGLPGSGKTTYLDGLVKDGLRCFDDFHAEARDDSIEPKASRYWSDMLESLGSGIDVVVADIAFCNPDRLTAFVNAVRAEVPSVQISYQAFANEPSRCLQNLIQTDAVESRFADLTAWAPQYRVPPEASIMPVQTSDDRTTAPPQ